MSSDGADGFRPAGHSWNVRRTFQDMWNTRPERPLEGTKVAGLAAAIGRRYRIDPVLPRVAFVVATFYGGAGIVLYLLGWLLLPKEGEPQTREITTGRRAAAVVLALLLAVYLTHRAGWFVLAVCLGALYMLHHYRGESARTVPDEETAPPQPDPAAPDESQLDCDLHEPPDPEPAPEPRHGRWVALITLGLAALAGGLTTVAGAPLEVVLAVLLAIFGAGMVVGAFLRGARALMWFAIPIGLLGLLLSAFSSGHWPAAGDSAVWPATAQEVRPAYHTQFGNVELHLDHLRIPPGQEIRTTASTAIGNVSVFVPRDADVSAQCHVQLGSTHCLNHQSAGSNGRIVLDLTAGVGNVEVIRD